MAREKFMCRIVKGGIQPADRYTAEKLRARKYNIGDIVAVEITKPRNPGFHGLAHHIGQLVVNNISEFENCDAHSALKRLQLEAGIACDEMMIRIPKLGAVIHRIPRSLSYESMGQEEFHEVVRAFCRHIAENYWPSLTPEKIEQMAESFVGE